MALLLTLGGEIQSVSSVVHAQEVQQSVKNVQRQADFNPQQYANEVDSFIKDQTDPDISSLFMKFTSQEVKDYGKYNFCQIMAVMMLI